MLSKTYSKYIQSLHHKKFRDANGAFIAEGDKVVKELLSIPKFICKTIVATEEWMSNNESFLTQFKEIEIKVEKQFDIDKISALTTPSTVIGVFEKSKEQIVKVIDRVVLCLDAIQDPGNLGTIIRIADWFGISSIVCSNNCVDVYSPKVVQSTMGSIARVNVSYTELPQWLTMFANDKIYAASLNGKAIAEVGKITKGILIIGNEGKGISNEVLQLANELVTIPKHGGAESLNAAVATGILVSHLI